MRIIADLHCHTIASVHAYNTLRDNINAAKRLGLSALAITDHGIGCPDGPLLSYFENLNSLPRRVEGLDLLKGVEANIMDMEGNLDMPRQLLGKLDIVVASFHSTCVKPSTAEDHTNAYLNIALNPDVDIIGHSGTPEFLYDYERVIPIFREYGKIVEINAHTFICRKKSIPNCKRIIELCKKYEVPVMVNSDAHSEFEVGLWSEAIEMLTESNFPDSLVVNANEENLERFFHHIGYRI